MTPQFIVLGPEGVDEASRGSHSSTTPLSVSTSLSPSKNLTGEPTVQSDSMRRLYQYFFVNSPRVSAAHNFSGVVAMYVTYTNSGLAMLILLKCFFQVVQSPHSAALVLSDPAVVDLADWNG